MQRARPKLAVKALWHQPPAAALKKAKAGKAVVAKAPTRIIMGHIIMPHIII
jgi:hypothetical protein